jgi:dipeptidyl aminopeptidase/acylaminoacyl peptidase
MQLRNGLTLLASTLGLLLSEHASSAEPGHAADSSSSRPPVGIAAFTRHSRIVDAGISPKGTYLAAISVEGGKRWMTVIDLKARKPASTFNPERASVGEFYWANDSRLVVQILDEGDGLQAAPVSHGELYAVDADGRHGSMIFGYRARSGERHGYASVIGRLPGDEQRILIRVGDFRDPGNSEVDKLDVYTGKTVLVTRNPVAEANYLTDESGEPRVAVGRTPDLKARFFYRDPDRGWSELSNLNGITKSSRPIGFARQSRTLNLVEPLAKGFGLIALNIDTGERKLLSQSEWVPPEGYLVDATSRQILAVRYEPDVRSYDFLVPDHPLSRVLKGLLEAYPDENVRLLNATDDRKKAMVLVSSDRDPGRFLLVDVDELSAEEIVSTRPWIKPEAMSEMTAFHIRARDGIWIHGYLTLPKSSSPATVPPLVVLPHGGPHFVRDYWAFVPEVQLLASEGFAVLQVNYRGSGGYGEGYQQAGYGHWGDRIVEDIIDATQYTVKKGHADPKRICIYGASFGAYAAMQGAILAPELFRCAIGFAGVYDLTRMDWSGDIASSWLGRDYVHAMLRSNGEALKRASPAYNADKLRARVLLIHGKKDQRAPIEHAEHLKDALEEKGRAPEWMVESKEGHGFYDEDARERMYTRLLRFLRENTAPVSPPKVN